MSTGTSPASPAVAPPALDTLLLHGKLHLGRLRACALDARDVDAEVALASGGLSISTLQLSIFGGRLVASGSRVDLTHGTPVFALRAQVERIDLGSLPRSGSGTELTGKLDADVSLDGTGTTAAAVAPTLAGTVKLSVDGAHVHGKHTLRGTIINPLIGKIAEIAKKKHPVREIDTTIDKAMAAVRVAGSKVTTTSPLTIHTDEGTVTVDGTVGFDGALSLTGSVVIPPAAIEKATKGVLVPYHDATVKLRVGGTSDAPRIELVDLDATVKALAGSWLHGVEKKIEHAFGKN